MFKSALLASLVVLGGSMLATSTASAGNPYCGPRYGGYQSFRPVVVAPYGVGRIGYVDPYVGPRYGSGFGYGYPGYNAFRPPIGGGFGYPYGYGSGLGGFNSFRGGSGFSLYLGR